MVERGVGAEGGGGEGGERGSRDVVRADGAWEIVA